MSINSVGSSFNHIPPVRAARETAASARVAEANDTATDRASRADDDWPPRVASEKVREQLQTTVYGRLVAAQEEATSRPRISSHDASRAYSKAG